MTILLLIRHASNDYLVAKRLAGWIPAIHLNVEGRHEADLTARRLAPVPIGAIYSSPLERALETAQAVASFQHSGRAVACSMLAFFLSRGGIP
jgi:broad specificity phosphatase PhoE